MKKNILLAILLTISITAKADPVETVASYFTNNIVTTTAFTNAGDTGMSTGTVYICFDVAELSPLTATQATGSVAAVVSSIVEYLYDAIEAMASTNQPANFTINESAEYESVSVLKTYHKIMTKKDVVSTYTYPSE